MEENRIKKLIEKLSLDNEFAKQVYGAKSKEEVKDLVKGAGLDITLDEIEEVKSILKKVNELMDNEEISDDELENATGGRITLKKKNENSVFVYQTTPENINTDGIAWRVIKKPEKTMSYTFTYEFNCMYSQDINW